MIRDMGYPDTHGVLGTIPGTPAIILCNRCSERPNQVVIPDDDSERELLDRETLKRERIPQSSNI